MTPDETHFTPGQQAPVAPAQAAQDQVAQQASSQAATAAAEAQSQAPAPPPPGTLLVPDEPMISGGYAGPAVKKLGELLAVCGYANNTLNTGDNPDLIADNTVLSCVQAFCQDHDIHEEQNGRDVTGVVVGGQTWKALYEEAKKALETPSQGS